MNKIIYILLAFFFLSCNGTKKIQKAAQNPGSVKKLNLRFHRMNEIPPEIGRLFALEELNLSNNRLKELPEEIGNLTKLKKLNLFHNKLESLPKHWQFN